MSASPSFSLPIVLMSETLLEDENPGRICGLHCVPFRVGGRGEVNVSGETTSLSADILVAIAGNDRERKSLEITFLALRRETPELIVARTRDEALDRIGEALSARVDASANREAALREELQSMRDSVAFALAPQGLVAILLDKLLDPADDLVCDASFEFVLHASVEVRGLAAIALCVTSENLGPGDKLEISLIGEETSERLGAWRVPGEAIAKRPEWLTLDLAIPLANARQRACIHVRGDLSRGGVLKFSQAVGEDQRPALRLYATRGPRLAMSPFWIWPGADARPTLPAMRLSSASWLNARRVGAAVELPSAGGDKRLRIGADCGAMLIFPNVVLKEIAAIAARVASQDANELEVAMSLLPVDHEISADHAKEEQAAFAWSTSQVLKDGDSAITLVLPADAPAAAHVAISVRNVGLQDDQATVLECRSIWLVPRKPRRPLRTFVSGKEYIGRRDANFDDVRLDEAFVSETYTHLDISVEGLSRSGRMWPAVKFKVFDELGAVGLEFRCGDGFPTCFSTWPATTSDIYGPFFKISGAAGLKDAKASFAKENDGLLLTAIEESLPSLIKKLQITGQLEKDEVERWLARVSSVSSERV